MEGEMQPSHAKVLIFDDDPMHLEIYGLLMKQAGYDFLPTLVRFSGAEIPCTECVGLVLLDYRLNSLKTPIDLAREIRAHYPTVPILLLSDFWALPTDIAPLVNGFVRKGEPAKLLESISKLIGAAPADRAILQNPARRSDNL
jgi:DNA-binding NtrC family response regulator